MNNIYLEKIAETLDKEATSLGVRLAAGAARIGRTAKAMPGNFRMDKEYMGVGTALKNATGAGVSSMSQAARQVAAPGIRSAKAGIGKAQAAAQPTIDKIKAKAQPAIDSVKRNVASAKDDFQNLRTRPNKAFFAKALARNPVVQGAAGGLAAGAAGGAYLATRKKKNDQD
jgi:hypothetical protein